MDLKIDAVSENQGERTVQTIQKLALSELEEENLRKEKVNQFKEEHLFKDAQEKKGKTDTPDDKAKLTERQKLSLCFLVLSVIMLVLAIIAAFDRGFDGWYYVFLRFVTCAALAGLVLEKLAIWFKFVLLLLVILYNPIVPVHLEHRENWTLANFITIILLCCGAIAAYRRLRKREQ